MAQEQERMAHMDLAASSWPTARVLAWLDEIGLSHLKDKFAGVAGRDLFHAEARWLCAQD